jgi:hypothetical protein
MAFDWLGVSKLLSDPRSVRGPVLFQIAGRAKMRRRSIGWQRHKVARPPGGGREEPGPFQLRKTFRLADVVDATGRMV